MGENIDLISEIEDKIKTVRTRSLDLSFNELLDMYKSGELIMILIIKDYFGGLLDNSRGSLKRYYLKCLSHRFLSLKKKKVFMS